MCCKSSGGGTPTVSGVPQVSAPTTAAPVPQSNAFMDTLSSIARQQQDKATNLYGPLEQQAVDSVQQFQTPQYEQDQEGLATADVHKSFGAAKEDADRQLASMGVNPNSGRYGFVKRGLAEGEALGTAAAARGARDSTRRLAYDTLTGLSARANTATGAAISAAGTGGQEYLGAQGNDLAAQRNTLTAQQLALQAQENKDAGKSAGLAGIGKLAGIALPSLIALSSKKAKTNRHLATGALAAARKMPAQTFRYKRGLGPTGPHVGPMAEDMQKATGAGDGVHINVADVAGLSLGAVQQLDKKVTRLEKRHG